MSINFPIICILLPFTTFPTTFFYEMRRRAYFKLTIIGLRSSEIFKTRILQSH